MTSSRAVATRDCWRPLPMQGLLSQPESALAFGGLDLKMGPSTFRTMDKSPTIGDMHGPSCQTPLFQNSAYPGACSPSRKMLSYSGAWTWKMGSSSIRTMGKRHTYRQQARPFGMTDDLVFSIPAASPPNMKMEMLTGNLMPCQDHTYNCDNPTQS